MKTVYVGMSGGVDSSVTALLLKQQGFNVIGVYMKNWTKDIPGFVCPWKEDYQDAKRVAVQLDIPLKLYDFEKQYKQKVVDYMIAEYQTGHTPNPDIMCNQEVKFKLFLKTALDEGADLIATGHYAGVKNSKLYMAKDSNKDQTYFLYRVEKDALSRTVFPLGDLTKTEVRKIALKNNLATAKKSESMGICFVGKVGVKDFLKQYVKSTPGDIIDQNGVKVGEHDGAIYYTIGQRHGLQVGGGTPYYVTSKDMKKNIIYVSTDLNDEDLWSSKVDLTNVHWINGSPNENDLLKVRTRHRAKLINIKSIDKTQKGIHLVLDEEVRALTPGQSAVIYRNNQCLGGGVISGGFEV